MIQFPHIKLSPWIDNNGQIWKHNGVGWGREYDAGDVLPKAPIDGLQYIRESGEWIPLELEDRYLGAYITPPISDALRILKLGDIYYDLPSQQHFTWDSMRWLSFAKSFDVTLADEYFWVKSEIHPEGTPLEGPDIYGLYPTDWVEGETNIAVYVGGLRFIEDISGSGVAGRYTVDYLNETITPINGDFPANEVVQVIVYHVIPSKPSLRPYVESIRPTNSRNRFSKRARVSVNSPTIVLIAGGNFSVKTHIVSPPGIDISEIDIRSDKLLQCTVLNTIGIGIYPIMVFTNQRPSFGEDLSVYSN